LLRYWTTLETTSFQMGNATIIEEVAKKFQDHDALNESHLWTRDVEFPPLPR
jgi:hypothetical protein